MTDEVPQDVRVDVTVKPNLAEVSRLLKESKLFHRRFFAAVRNNSR